MKPTVLFYEKNKDGKIVISEEEVRAKGKIIATTVFIVIGVIVIFIIIGIISMVLVLAVTPIVLRFMVLTETARSYLVGMMAIMSFYMIGRSICTVVINGIFCAGGDTLFDMYSLAVCMWGIAIRQRKAVVQPPTKAIRACAWVFARRSGNFSYW